MTTSSNDPLRPTQSSDPDDPLVRDPLDRDPLGSEGSDPNATATGDPMDHELGDRWSPSASDPDAGAAPTYSSSGVGDTSTYASGLSETPTYSSGTYSAGDYSDDSGDSGAAGAAKDEAKRLKDATAGATQQVTSTAKEQVGQVAGTAKEQAGQLVGETRNQLSEQIVSQKDRASGGLRSLAEEMRAMADRESGESGLATQLARQGAEKTNQVADFLEDKEPAEILDELRNIARQRPGAFLLGAALAGVAVGRLTRGAISARSDDDDTYSYGRYDAEVGSTYPGGYTGMAEPVASPYSGSVPPPASAPLPPPVLDEPYGTGQPPAGYDSGQGGRL